MSECMEEEKDEPTGLDACHSFFRPELMNRLSKVVTFQSLGIESAREILRKLVTEFNQRLAGRGVSVELDASAEELLLQQGFSEMYGARNLERILDQRVGALIAGEMLAGRARDGRKIRVTGSDLG